MFKSREILALFLKVNYIPYLRHCFVLAYEEGQMGRYKNVKPTSKHLKDLLGGFERHLKEMSLIPTEDILGYWPKIVGDNISEMTKAVEFRDGTLFVLVNNSSLYTLLTLHEKHKLLKLLKDKFPSIVFKNIQFRLG